MVLVALSSAAAVLIWRLFRAFAGDGVGLAVAAVWIVAPNHGSLLYWASGVNIALALVLLLAGLLLLARDRVSVAALLLAASVLCYEATASAAVVGLIAVPWRLGRPLARPLLTGAAALAPVAAWMIVFWHPAKGGIRETADLGQLVPAHVGWGVMPRGVLTSALGLLACVGAALLIVDLARRRVDAVPGAPLAAAGIATILIGTLPFVRYFYGPLGIGDRANVVAAVGTAMLWTGLGLAAWRALPRLVAGVLVIVTAVSAFVALSQASAAWARAGDDAVTALADVRTSAPGVPVAIRRRPLERNVAPFLDDSNVRSAVQLLRDDRDAEAHLVPP